MRRYRVVSASQKSGGGDCLRSPATVANRYEGAIDMMQDATRGRADAKRP